MLKVNNRILYAVLAAAVAAAVLVYLVVGPVALTAPTIGLNSPTTFPVDI